MGYMGWIAASALFVSLVSLGFSIWATWKSSKASDEANSVRKKAAKSQKKISQIFDANSWSTRWLTADKYLVTNDGKDAHDVTFNVSNTQILDPLRFVFIGKHESVVVELPGAWQTIGATEILVPRIWITWHRKPDKADKLRGFDALLAIPPHLQQPPQHFSQRGLQLPQGPHSQP